MATWSRTATGLPATNCRGYPSKIPTGLAIWVPARWKSEVQVIYKREILTSSSNVGGWPKIKLDLTTDEKLVLPVIRREIFHTPAGGVAAGKRS
jgi:hypothetical protein